jgi:hypothetical protein
VGHPERSLTLTGVVGHLKWHYYTAAAINGYTVTRVGAVWSLTANVILADAFKLSQTPLTFVAKHTKGEWRFPILSSTLNKDTHRLTARLGPPEK